MSIKPTLNACPAKRQISVGTGLSHAPDCRFYNGRLIHAGDLERPQARSRKGAVGSVALIISFALIVGLFSLAVLLWALANGQYDDPDGDAARILLDDDQAE